MIFDAWGNEFRRPKRCGFPVPEAAIIGATPDGDSCDAVGFTVYCASDETEEARLTDDSRATD
jgi:hypothetical protein